jgi:hypothetical protein
MAGTAIIGVVGDSEEPRSTTRLVRTRRVFGLERFKKYHSHSVRAVFFCFGFVSAQLQAAAGMRLRQSLAKTKKSSLRTAILFLETL